MNKGPHKSHMTRGRLIFLISLLIIFAILASCVRNETSGEDRHGDINAADQHHTLLQLNQASEQAYQYIRDHLPEQAYQEVQSLSRLLTHFQFSGFTGVEGMAAITTSVTELSGRLHAIKYDEEKALHSASKVRLAIDALGEREQPMWRQYGNTIRTDLGHLKHAADQNDHAALQTHFNLLYHHYDVVRPSLLVRNSSSDIQMLDSLLQYMNRMFAKVEASDTSSSRNAKHFITELEKAFAPIFGWSSSSAYVAIDESREQWLFSLVLAAIIITVLGYVGWRKYHYDQRQIQPVYQNRTAEKERMY